MRTLRRILFVLIAIITAVMVVQSSYGPSTDSAEPIVLASHCPPGFELTDENTCKCRNLYQQYESLRESGVGGLKTALPAIRDGFSPQQIDLGRLLFFDPVLSGD